MICACGQPVSGKYAHYCHRCAAARRRKPSKWKPTEQIDALIREAWSDTLLHGKAAALYVVERTGWPKWKVCRRAVEIGVARREPKEPPWSAAELAILEQYAWMCEDRIRDRLKRAGFHRTRVAINLKRKRLKLLANIDGYSSNRLALLLGIDRHKVLKWVNRGWLRAEKRGYIQGSGEVLYIPHSAVRPFVLSHLEEIDLGKADKLWVVDLLTDGKFGLKGAA